MWDDDGSRPLPLRDGDQVVGPDEVIAILSPLFDAIRAIPDIEERLKRRQRRRAREALQAELARISEEHRARAGEGPLDVPALKAALERPRLAYLRARQNEPKEEQKLRERRAEELEADRAWLEAELARRFPDDAEARAKRLVRFDRHRERTLRLIGVEAELERLEKRLRSACRPPLLPEGALVLRRYRRGEVVVEQGDPGGTAFYIVPRDGIRRLQALRADARGDPDAGEDEAGDGELSAWLDRRDPRLKRGPVAEVELRVEHRPDGQGGLLARVLSGVRRLSQSMAGAAAPDPALSESLSLSRSTIPNDGPIDLARSEPRAVMYEGELFGEMSCINRMPRSATVRATEDGYMLEMVRSVLDVLRGFESFNLLMLETYKERVLELHLHDLELFAGVSARAFQELKDGVELETFEPGETIFKQGQGSPCMYVVRLGQVRVVQHVGGTARVLAYRGRGELIGEMGVLRGENRSATCEAYGHPPGATTLGRYTPGRVELVRISAGLFRRLLKLAPGLEDRVRRIVERKVRAERDEAKVPLTGPLEDLGLLQGQKLMLIDLTRCTRCDDCVTACAKSHDDRRPRLVREGPRFGRYLVPTSCRQCRDPVCMIGCPVGSIVKGWRGEIRIEDWCIGCQACADQCPYGSISMHARTAKDPPSDKGAPLAVVCDQCSSLSDGIPSCVYACPHDAAARVDAWSFFTRPELRRRSLTEITYETVERGGL